MPFLVFFWTFTQFWRNGLVGFRHYHAHKKHIYSVTLITRMSYRLVLNIWQIAKYILHFNVPIQPDRKIAVNLSALKYKNNSFEHLISVDTLKIDKNCRITLTKRIREILRVGPCDTLGFFVDARNDNSLIFRIQRSSSTDSMDSWILSRILDENISLYASDSSVMPISDRHSQSYAIGENIIKTLGLPKKEKNKINLLIVEDEKDTAFFLEKILCSEGYKLEMFQNPIDALTKISELMDSFYFDLVIIDIRMPILNGLQLYQLLRLMNKNLKVIFVSALDGIEEMVSLLPGLGNDNILKKPFEGKTLIQKVDTILR